jgi:hypothetical protein
MNSCFSCCFSLLLVLSTFFPLFLSHFDHNRSESILPHRRLADSSAATKCVKWGNTFDVSLSSNNVERKCQLPSGKPICCAALEERDPLKEDLFSKGIGNNFSPKKLPSSISSFSTSSSTIKGKENTCIIEKKYFSSPQELRDLAKAKEISLLSSDHTDERRVKALVDYVISEEIVKNSTIWLDRVKSHMTDDKSMIEKGKEHDLEFLSRFEVSRSCEDSTFNDQWIEWIEPLTITARHPFGFGRCRLATPHFRSDTPRTDRSNVDYVLLQSGESLFKQNYHNNGKRFNYINKKQKNAPIKHFMFDAGTSTFDSSLYWFTCGYSQVFFLFYFFFLSLFLFHFLSCSLDHTSCVLLLASLHSPFSALSEKYWI